MRTFELISGFNEKELKELGFIIESKKRKNLKVLFNMLVQHKHRKIQPTNTALFEQLFEKKYDPGKDYILRHELRLLNKIIYDHLVLLTFKEQVDKDPNTYHQWLTKGLYNRKMNDVFRTDIDKFIEQSKKDIKPFDTSVMLHYKSLWLINNQRKTVENLNHQLSFVEELNREETRYYLYRLREYEARKAYLEYSLLSLDQVIPSPNGKTEPCYNINLAMADPTGWYENYLILKKYSFQTIGQQRIDVLHQMLAIEESPTFKGEFAFSAQVATMINLAKEFIFIDKYEYADNMLEKAINLCELNKQPVLPSALLNYIGNQLNRGDYAKGINTYETYKEQILNSRTATQAIINKSFCLIFLNRIDEALQCVSGLINLTQHEQLLQRLLYIITFCKRGQYELALNENNNLAKTLKSKKGETVNVYLFISSLFKLYLTAGGKAVNNAETYKKLTDKINTNRNWINVLIKREFALRWLLNELAINMPVK